MGIRRNLAQRLDEVASPDLASATARKQSFVDRLRLQPIAIETDTANKQHYEVGTGVLAATLGPYMKYSCCWYPEVEQEAKGTGLLASVGRQLSPLMSLGSSSSRTTLAEAEVAMLQSYIVKAQLEDGMRILDLG